MILSINNFLTKLIKLIQKDGKKNKACLIVKKAFKKIIHFFNKKLKKIKNKKLKIRISLKNFKKDFLVFRKFKKNFKLRASILKNLYKKKYLLKKKDLIKIFKLLLKLKKVNKSSFFYFILLYSLKKINKNIFNLFIKKKKNSYIYKLNLKIKTKYLKFNLNYCVERFLIKNLRSFYIKSIKKFRKNFLIPKRVPLNRRYTIICRDIFLLLKKNKKKIPTYKKLSSILKSCFFPNKKRKDPLIAINIERYNLISKNKYLLNYRY